jgi:hypothetical protein
MSRSLRPMLSMTPEDCCLSRLLDRWSAGVRVRMSSDGEVSERTGAGGLRVDKGREAVIGDPETAQESQPMDSSKCRGRVRT